MRNVQQSATATGRIVLSAGFPIMAVRIDNLTNQWLQITGQRTFIPPYIYGAVYPLYGAGSIEVSPTTPIGILQDAAITGEQFTAIVYDEQLIPSPGSIVPHVGPASGVVFGELGTFLTLPRTIGPTVSVSSAVYNGTVAPTLPVAGNITRTIRSLVLKADRNATGLFYLGLMQSKANWDGGISPGWFPLAASESFVYNGSRIFVRADNDADVLHVLQII